MYIEQALSSQTICIWQWTEMSSPVSSIQTADVTFFLGGGHVTYTGYVTYAGDVTYAGMWHMRACDICGRCDVTYACEVIYGDISVSRSHCRSGTTKMSFSQKRKAWISFTCHVYRIWVLIFYTFYLEKPPDLWGRRVLRPFPLGLDLLVTQNVTLWKMSENIDFRMKITRCFHCYCLCLSLSSSNSKVPCQVWTVKMLAKRPKNCILFMNGITETTNKINPAKTVLAPTLHNSETSTL